ncbi:GAF domain-containing protein [Mucilaginibacter lappiensis]|uniref:GAF domain-containing protein n=1 Tax=Mucilaginibacter lappiensis TaxID=354630 RepID=UPI003D22E931
MTLPEFEDNPFQIRLSFHKIIEHLELAYSEKEDSATRKLLDEIREHPELKDGITTIEQIEDNSALIAKISGVLFPPLLTNNEIKALSIPYQGLIFNYSKRFREIIQAAGDNFEIAIRNFDDHQFYVFSCCLILNQFYGTSIDFAKPLFCDIPSGKGYTRHFRILYNADFLEIVAIKETPVLTKKDIKRLLNNYDDLDLWKEKFPRETWLMKGFALMSLIDVTTENAVSQLKGDLLGNGDDPELHLKMESVFRSIFRISEVKIGFTSYDEINGKFRNITFGQQIQSFLLANGNNEALTRNLFKEAYEKLVNDNTYFAIADVSEFIRHIPGSAVAKNFKSFKIASFILAPIVKNGSILGFLELASPHRNVFNSVNANRLENLMQYLTDTIDRKIAEFRNRVQAVIQNNYTTLHPSVNWKFEREVHNFIRITASGKGYDLREIKFKNVYPLYAQLDIQNSSITRNNSTLNDLTDQLGQLARLFTLVGSENHEAQVTPALSRIQLILDDLASGLKSDSEQHIQKLLETFFHPLLTQQRTSSPKTTSVIDAYLDQAGSVSGAFSINRRNYDRTLADMNGILVTILDKRHEEIQQLFPHYFERFKTDGVEHNLYIGESIYPDHEFAEAELERLRMWQLLVTAEMETAQRKLKNTLPYPLGLTALILVYSTPINIRFRMDEKHFDLDGAYDIRYEIVKKRIDKAHIKDTSLRITEKEKLTIVYAKDEERESYYQYISILQNLGVFSGSVEDLEIEDLQGVSGLKALRIGIGNDRSITSYDGLYQTAYDMLSKKPGWN